MSASESQPLCQIRTEILRAAKLCSPGLESLGRLTFDSDPTEVSAVAHWRDAVFLPLLAPAIRDTATASRQGCRELVCVDKALDKRLAGPLAKTSRASGLAIANALQAPNSEPALKKFLAAVGAGTTPGHMVIVFSARASVFHFPVQVIAGALVVLEMRTATVDSAWGAVQSCLESLPPAEASLRAA
jgi:hypothetical protein